MEPVKMGLGKYESTWIEGCGIRLPLRRSKWKTFSCSRLLAAEFRVGRVTIRTTDLGERCPGAGVGWAGERLCGLPSLYTAANWLIPFRSSSLSHLPSFFTFSTPPPAMGANLSKALGASLSFSLSLRGFSAGAVPHATASVFSRTWVTPTSTDRRHLSLQARFSETRR